MQLTGVFTAPRSGDYQFNFQARNKENNDAYGDMRLLKDGATMTYSQMRKDYFTMFGTAILSLQAGNKVWVETFSSLSSSPHNPTVHFTGSMLNMA